MLQILDSNGNVKSQSKNLRGIRAHCSKNVAKIIDISPVGNGEGQLSILFDNGDSFQCNFADWDVLVTSVRNWRNLYGVRFSYCGNERGTLSYDHYLLN